MRRRALRAFALIAALTLFEGVPGLVAGIVIAVAYEVVAVPLSLLWAAAVTAIAVAPVAMVIQTTALRIQIGAGFAASNVLARTLIGAALALALYAAIAELTDGTRVGDARRATSPGRASFLTRRREHLPAKGLGRSDPGAPSTPFG